MTINGKLNDLTAAYNAMVKNLETQYGLFKQGAKTDRQHLADISRAKAEGINEALTRLKAVTKALEALQTAVDEDNQRYVTDNVNAEIGVAC